MTSATAARFLDIPGWTSRRQQLHERLHERAAPLAGLYASAVFLLGTSGWPGRYHLLGHSVREIAQRLPDFLAPQPRSRSQRDEALDSFVDAWRAAGLPVTAAGASSAAAGLREDDAADAADETSPAETYAVPLGVVATAAALVDAHEQISINNYDKAASIILARANADVGPLIDDADAPRDATVLLWTKTVGWFMKLTHASAEPERTPPGGGELRHQFEVIESTLEAILAPFYQVVDDLDEILAVANAPTDAAKTDEEGVGPGGLVDDSGGKE
jgi:hypothetical protein